MTETSVAVVFDPPSNGRIDLSNLVGAEGFRIDGETSSDQTGLSVSNAGDLNGDGFDDLIIGTPYAKVGLYHTGEAYVVFGGLQGFPSSIDLSSLDGTTGFKLHGVLDGDRTGMSVSGGGDVNGDGFADLGAPQAGVFEFGAAYVVFGHGGSFAAVVDLSTLAGTSGFKITDEYSHGLGRSVANAGDVNGDGFDDLIVGAPAADGAGYDRGES